MALTEEDKKEITKLIHKEMYNTALDISEHFQKTQPDLEVREQARIIGNTIRDELRKKFQNSFDDN